MTQWVEGLLDQLGYPGIAFLMLLENAVPPVPSEVVMPLAGVTASGGKLSPWLAVLAGTVGAVLGSFAWFYVGRWLGVERLRRFASGKGRALGLKEADVDASVRFFERHGGAAVLVGKFVPGIRTWIAIPAGVFGMSALRFALYAAAGTLFWNSVLVALGYFLKDQWREISSTAGTVGTIVVTLAIAGVIAWLVRRRRLN